MLLPTQQKLIEIKRLAATHHLFVVTNKLGELCLYRETLKPRYEGSIHRNEYIGRRKSLETLEKLVRKVIKS